MKIILTLALFIFLASCGIQTDSPDLDLYYAPKIYSESEYYSVSVPVEIALKEGKQPFVNLFKLYGFSGNGPSIEQVIRHNANLTGFNYDSEGDAFYGYAESEDKLRSTLSEIMCIENLECLNDWLIEANSIVFKE